MAKDILYPLRRLHGKLHDLNEKIKLRKKYCAEFKKNPKTVFLLLTPEHGNLGDHAIAKAETEFLKKLDINYIEITGDKLNKMKWANQLDVFNGFPILLQGGGYLGTLWYEAEVILRDLLTKNKKSNIFILPNTIFYEENEWGKEELQKSIKIYNKHKHLTIFAREQTSYDLMKSIYHDVRFVPDMVLSLKIDNNSHERKGCLLCLRSDCEKTLTKEQVLNIRLQAENLFGTDVTDTDMVVTGKVTVEQRDTALQAKFEEFSKSQLVITDRLHGMIFCAITGTPCIVVNSKSPKVKGCYEWIKHLEYIRFVENSNDIITEFQEISKKAYHYDNSHLIPYYQALAEDVQKIWR